MAFDFTVSGDPADDRLACAVNDLNVFTLPAKFAPDGQPVSTDMMDVSAYAGKSVEFFFGLVGGTSTSCEVAVDGIRFITVPPPRVVLSPDPAASNNLLVQVAGRGNGLHLGGDGRPRCRPLAGGAHGRGRYGGGWVATLATPRSGPRRIYRLRRSP